MKVPVYVAGIKISSYFKTVAGWTPPLKTITAVLRKLKSVDVQRNFNASDERNSYVLPYFFMKVARCVDVRSDSNCIVKLQLLVAINTEHESGTLLIVSEDCSEIGVCRNQFHPTGDGESHMKIDFRGCNISLGSV